MRWAHSPEEVPAWDVTRGFPLREPMAAIDFSDGAELAVMRELLSDPAWTPAPPPISGYPRLVREGMREPARTYGYGHEGAAVIAALQSIARHFELDETPPFSGKRLENEVLAVANKYGAPMKPEDNTLSEWVRLAVWVAAHLESMQVLQDESPDALREHLAAMEARWRSVPDPFRPGQRGMGGPYLYLRSWVDRDPAAPQRYIRGQLMGMATGVTGLVYFNDIEQFGLPMSLREQANLALAAAWVMNAPVGVCEGCGRAFLVTRRDRRFCHARCRQKRPQA